MSITRGVSERAVGRDPAALQQWTNLEAIPLLKELRDAVNTLLGTTTATPTGPAAFQIGGTYPDLVDVRGVRETGGPTNLTIGAIADGEFTKRVGATLVGGSPSTGADTAGSIFSMTGPGGAADPVVAYDFTKFDPALTTAQNLTAANMSGNANLDLVAVSGAKIDFLTLSGDAGQSPYAWTPFACRSDGGALKTGFFGGVDAYVETSATPSEIRSQAAMTAEWLGYVTENPTANAALFISMLGATEAEADNIQYQLFHDAGTQVWGYAHENGAGADNAGAFFLTPAADFTQTISNPIHLALTRASGGLGVGRSVRMYINGRLAQIASGITGVSALPTGGTSAKLRISSSTGSGRFETLGVRLFDAELTADQVRESYRRTAFGVGV